MALDGAPLYQVLEIEGDTTWKMGMPVNLLHAPHQAPLRSDSRQGNTTFDHDEVYCQMPPAKKPAESAEPVAGEWMAKPVSRSHRGPASFSRLPCTPGAGDRCYTEVCWALGFVGVRARRRQYERWQERSPLTLYLTIPVAWFLGVPSTGVRG
jgi:hypothetical protein